MNTINPYTMTDIRSGYTCKYNSSDKDLQSRVRECCERFNDLIDFEQHYHMLWKEPLSGHGKCKCKLHGEVQGESFSYKKSTKFWSCWGSCKTNAAGIVEYHLMYMQKHTSAVKAPKKTGITTDFMASGFIGVNIIDAIRDLERLYPSLPKMERSHSKEGAKETISGLETLRKNLRMEQNRNNIINDAGVVHKIESSVAKFGNARTGSNENHLDTLNFGIYMIFMGDALKLERRASSQNIII